MGGWLESQVPGAGRHRRSKSIHTIMAFHRSELHGTARRPAVSRNCGERAVQVQSRLRSFPPPLRVTRRLWTIGERNSFNLRYGGPVRAGRMTRDSAAGVALPSPEPVTQGQLLKRAQRRSRTGSGPRARRAGGDGERAQRDVGNRAHRGAPFLRHRRHARPQTGDASSRAEGGPSGSTFRGVLDLVSQPARTRQPKGRSDRIDCAGRPVFARPWLRPTSARRSGNGAACRPWSARPPEPVPQLAAFFTSSPILFSSAAVSLVRAYEVGHIAPSSRFAASSKPNVAYLDLNLSAALKKQTSLPSFA